MKLQPLSQGKSRRSFAMVAIAATMLGALLAFGPTPAAAETTAIAHLRDADGNTTKSFTKISDAVSAGYAAYDAGGTIVMDDDWRLSTGSLDLADSKSLSIDMAGHEIVSKNEDATIYLNEHATLKLSSSAKVKDFAVTGSVKGDKDDISSQSWYRTLLVIKSCGLINNYVEKDHKGSGIHLENGANLTLEDVAVAGATNNGIEAKDGCTITLNRATISHNKGSTSSEYKGTGGGIKLGASCNLYLDASHIDDNYVLGNGGGVWAGSGAKIFMKNGSTISRNAATVSGGGIFIADSYFEIKDTDQSCSISDNASYVYRDFHDGTNYSGGGIRINGAIFGNYQGLIEGVTVTGNYSNYTGGGIDLAQPNTTLRNCTITGNHSTKEGGGVYVDHSGITMDNCTITGNWCGGSYEGGGVFVTYRYDLKMTGVCTVKGNTRGKDSGNADDVFLNTISGQTGFAYITGGVKKGSSIGVRTPNAGDRRIGNKINNETKDCFFADLDGYYVSYGTDHGGDMWQRHATKEFTVSVNGRAVGRYRNGSTVTVSGAAADASKAFARWDAGGTTGLYPFADYVADESSPTLTFKMPQNDVDLAAEYVGRTDSVALFVAMPTAGAELDESANLTWGDGEWAGVQVAWLVEGGDGWAPASGRAAWGATYKAVLAVGRGEALSHGLAFAASMDAGRQSVVAGATGVGAQSAAVDADGGLTLTSNEIRTAGPRVTSVEGASATVKAIDEEQDLRAALPSVALGTTDSGETVALKVERDDFDLRACGLVGDNGKVAYPEGGTKAVRIPVSSADGSVAVPDGTAVEVVVRVTQNGAGGGDGGVDTVPAAPVVTPDSGSYSVSGDAGSFNGAGQLVVGATCEQGASVVWEVRYKDPGDDGYRTLLEGAQGARVGLAAGEGGTRRYEVTAVAVRGGASSEPTKREYDVSGAAARKVTVRYADTAAEGRHGDRADDSYAVADGSGVTLVAPAREGYVFERWAGEGGETLGEGATLRLEKVEADTAVTAVYNPAVTEVDVSFAAPVAHGALASTATVRAKVGGMDEAVDITGQFVGGAGGAAVTWSPAAGADGAAAHETAYTASLTFGGGHAVTSDPKYVLPANATLKFGGNVVPGGAAWLADGEGGARLFCVAFPSTGPLEEPVVEAPRDVELTYERALAAQGGGAQAWGLPQTVSATCKCGESVELAVEWGQVAGFDASRAEAQELTVRGKVTFPDYVDSNGADGTPASDEVCVRVRVAAPKGGGGEEGETPVAPGGDEAGGKEGKAEEDGAGKAEGGGSGEPKALPATGDPGHPAAGALLAASAACLAAAAARHRSRR